LHGVAEEKKRTKGGRALSAVHGKDPGKWLKVFSNSERVFDREQRRQLKREGPGGNRGAGSLVLNQVPKGLGDNRRAKETSRKKGWLATVLGYRWLP